MKKVFRYGIPALLIIAVSYLAIAWINDSSGSQDSPLRVLMITGGGWHDYDTQKVILEEGISERAHIEFTIDHSAGESSDGDIERHENTDWAEEFDLVLYNMCFADMRDAEWSQRIVRAHVEHNVPAVILHCAMHSYNYHGDDDMWHRFAGVRTHRHQSQKPFTIEILEPDHPVIAHLPDGWTTPEGELYNVVEEYETATPLARSYGEDTDQFQVNIWVNNYEGVRVFGTTIGHHNVTMEHENYLNLVTAGLLWAADKLDENGLPESGFGLENFGR